MSEQSAGTRLTGGRRSSTRAPHTAGDGRREAPCVRPYLADVLEVLDVHALGVHDLLDDVGPHLLLALTVPVAVRAGALRLLPARGAAGLLRQLFLIDSQLQPTQRGQVTWGGGRWKASLASTSPRPVREAAWPSPVSCAWQGTPCQRPKPQWQCRQLVYFT